MKLIVTASFIFHVLLLASFTAGDHYRLSCGTPSTDPTTHSEDGWVSDNNSTFSHDFSSTTSASTNPVNIDRIPYSTARIFRSNFTYTFPVDPGPKFIRLYFYPATYSSASVSFPTADPYLSLVSSSGHTLLHNFSAYLSLSSSSALVVTKEFYVNVRDSLLQLTFYPTSPSYYAFVNGIEVVSVPETLYYRPESVPKIVPQTQTQLDVEFSTAMETAYRLDVGGVNSTLMIRPC